MKNLSIYLGKFFGIPTSIHWTFWLLIVWVVYINLSQGQGGIETLWYVFFILVIFVCVVLHELGHALAARRYGVGTKSITILPIGGLASLERIPEKPQQELVVAFAGPLVNIMIAALLFIFLFLTGGLTIDIESIASISASNFLVNLLIVNIVLVVFNMIPAFPMDGGRVLRSLLAMKTDRLKATEWAVNVGKVFAFLFVIWGFFNNPFLAIIGLFIFLGAQSELQQVRSQSLFANFTVKDVLMTDFTILYAHHPIAEAINATLDGQQHHFLVSDLEGNIIGFLTKIDIVKGIAQFGQDAPIDRIMQNKVLWLSPEMPLQQVQLQMMKEKIFIAPVGENKALKGVLNLENLNEFLMFQSALKNRKKDPFEGFKRMS